MIPKRTLLFLIMALLSVSGLYAQQRGEYSVKVKLTDSVSREPVSYATIYVSRDGSAEKAFYAMTDGNGVRVISNIPGGKYVFVAELMGYYRLSSKIELKDKVTDLGEMLMNEDITMLDEVVVTAVGNQVVVKKDTVEYTASLFKTTDNDMLEDLLKKLPGVEWTATEA